MAEEQRTELGEALEAAARESVGVVLHVNYMQAHGGPFDVALDFGSRIGQEEAQTIVRVFMSWEHLKVMIPVLQQQLEAYEEQVGDVPNLLREPEGTR